MVCVYVRGGCEYLVSDLLEVDLHRAAVDPLVLVRTVDEHRQLLGADLLSSVPEHKQHGVDHVGLPAPVRPDDAGEALWRYSRRGHLTLPSPKENRYQNYIKLNTNFFFFISSNNFFMIQHSNHVLLDFDVLTTVGNIK